MMFMGPYEGDVEWSTETINGVSRFVSKYYDFLLDKWGNASLDDNIDVQKGVVRLINKVENDILNFKFNTAISALMEFYNKYSGFNFTRDEIIKLVVCIAPIFPHMAEELWNITGHDYSVHMESWPEIEQSLLKDEVIEVPVQINGKVRGRITMKVDSTEDEIKGILKTDVTFSSYFSEGEIRKFMYITGKIISVVI
jgi:leucyl-tRNA synthetase